jgi:hypothetical protein
MKFVYGLDGDETLPVTATTDDTTSTPVEALKSLVGVNNSFYAFANDGIPAGYEGNMTVDFTDAPKVKGRDADNQAAIDAMLANPPVDKLTMNA